MRVRVKFKYPHEVNQIVRPNFKVAGRKYIEELGSTVKGGGDFCYTKLDATTLEAKRKAKLKRVEKYLKRKSQHKYDVVQVPATAAGRGYG